MQYNYFERMVDYERKQNENRRVYAMLAETAEDAPLHGLRVALGHGIIRLGARLAGESVQLTVPYLPDKHVLSQNN